MNADDGITHLDSLQMALVQHYMNLSAQLGDALRLELEWLPE